MTQPDTLAKLAADNVPERIYLVLGEDIAPDDDPRADFNDLGEVTWCADKQFNHDIEYVRADVAALTAQALPAAPEPDYSASTELLDGHGFMVGLPLPARIQALLDIPAALPNPAGWVSVPPEPSDAMLDAMRREAHSSKGAREKALRMYRAMITAAATTGAPTTGGGATAGAARTPAMPEDQIEALAHRMCWQYKHSTDPAHSSSYKFNRDTLIDFARKLELGWPASLATAALQQSIATMESAATHLEALPKMHQGKLLAHDLRRAASCCETAISALPRPPQPQEDAA